MRELPTVLGFGPDDEDTNEDDLASLMELAAWPMSPRSALLPDLDDGF